jgi:hypothetical protein
MNAKSRIISPMPLTFLIIGLAFLILPLLDISPYEMAVVGVVDLLALLPICFRRLRRYEPLVKFSVPIFNIVVFSYQAYAALTFSSVGYSANVIATATFSAALAAASAITLLFFSKS